MSSLLVKHHHHRNIIASSTRIRRDHEFQRGISRLAVTADDVSERVVLHMTGEAITAEHESGTTPQGATYGIHNYLVFTSQGTDQDIAVFVGPRLRCGELADLDQPGYQRMITR